MGLLGWENPRKTTIEDKSVLLFASVNKDYQSSIETSFSCSFFSFDNSRRTNAAITNNAEPFGYLWNSFCEGKKQRNPFYRLLQTFLYISIIFLSLFEFKWVCSDEETQEKQQLRISTSFYLLLSTQIIRVLRFLAHFSHLITQDRQMQR